jgi:hypothetical protein
MPGHPVFGFGSPIDLPDGRQEFIHVLIGNVTGIWLIVFIQISVVKILPGITSGQ